MPLLDIVYEALMDWYEYRKAQEKITGISFTAPDNYVFATSKGELRSRWGANTILTRFLKRHDLYNKGIHFHALRQTFSNALFAEESDDKLITDLLGHTKIGMSREHYNSIEKFDSVQKAARMFNAKFKPKNPKYCAPENTTYAPEGYLSEQDDVSPETEAEVQSFEPLQESKQRPISELLNELASYPEFQEIMKKMSKGRNPEIEAE